MKGKDRISELEKGGITEPQEIVEGVLAFACYAGFQFSDLGDDAVLDCGCDCGYEGGDDDRGVLRVKTDLRIGNENEVLR